jgi:hypothetical protein
MGYYDEDGKHSYFLFLSRVRRMPASHHKCAHANIRPLPLLPPRIAQVG